MAGFVRQRKAGPALAVLAILLAEPAFGQPAASPPPARAAAPEIYYGTTQYVPVVAPEDLPPAAPLDVTVVPAVVQYPAPPAMLPDAGVGAGNPNPSVLKLPDPEPQPPALHGAVDVVRDGARSVSAVATTVLDRMTERLAAPRERHEIQINLTPPAEFPALRPSTPLPTPAPDVAAQHPAVETSEVSLTAGRLLMFLAIAVGVALGVSGIGIVCLFLRRQEPIMPQFVASPTRFDKPPVTDLPQRPLEISEKGFPQSGESPNAPITNGAPEPTVPPAAPLPKPAAVRSTRPDDVLAQFILDQNLAVLSAIGTTDDMRIAIDVVPPVRIS